MDDHVLIREESVTTQHEPQWQTLSPDQLSKKMFEIVDDVNAVFQVNISCITDQSLL